MWKFQIMGTQYQISIRRAVCYLIVGFIFAAMVWAGLLVTPLNAAWSSYIIAHLLNMAIGGVFVSYFGEMLYIVVTEAYVAYRMYVFRKVFG